MVPCKYSIEKIPTRMQELQRNYAAIEEEPCSGSSVGSPLTKAFHWGRSNTIWAAFVVSRPAELR